MADGIYNKCLHQLLSGGTDLSSDTIKLMLVGSGYTFSKDHNWYSDVSANEIAASGGYTTGGATVANDTFTEDDTGDLAYYDADDVVWATATFTAYGAILYKSTGVAGTSPLLAYYDFGGAKTGTGADFVAAVNPGGLIAMAQAA